MSVATTNIEFVKHLIKQRKRRLPKIPKEELNIIGASQEYRDMCADVEALSEAISKGK